MDNTTNKSHEDVLLKQYKNIRGSHNECISALQDLSRRIGVARNPIDIKHCLDEIIFKYKNMAN